VIPARRAQVAVVGAGIVGLATADALTAHGVDVVCFEAGVPGSGQSAGLARSFRHVHEDERLVELAVAARAGWRRWEERFGRRLLGPEGALFAGSKLEERANALDAAGVEATLVDGEALRAALPVATPDAPAALFDPQAGSIRARRAIELLANALGPSLVPAEVIGLDVRSTGALVETSEGFWTAETVILCAGRRTPALAAAVGIEIGTRTTVHARVAFRVRPEHEGRRLACWTDRTDSFGERVYSTPLGTTGQFAVGLGGGGRDPELASPIDAPAVRASASADVERVCAYVARALPGLDPEPVSVRLCHLTELRGGGDVFAAWRAGPVLAFAGGNLFKLAPELGRLLADAATSGALPELLAAPIAAT
jgi:sarcosine oxidase